MSLELTGVHGLLKRHKLFTHKKYRKINILEKLGRQGIWFRSAAFVLLFWSVILFGVFGPDYEASQFIYFQF